MLGCGHPAMKAVGVRELSRCLEGECGLSEAIEEGKRATRRYAKRQVTWFRHQMAGAEVFRERFSRKIAQCAISICKRSILTEID